MTLQTVRWTLSLLARQTARAARRNSQLNDAANALYVGKSFSKAEDAFSTAVMIMREVRGTGWVRYSMPGRPPGERRFMDGKELV